MTARRRPAITGTHLAMALSAAALSLAGLLWLEQSSELSACGRRIANLQQHRSDLLERRSEALIRYAEATAPGVRQARAAEIGFRPVDEVVYVAVPPETYDSRPAVPHPVDGPMRIVHGDAIADAAASTSGPWSGRFDERPPAMTLGAPADGAPARGAPSP